MSEQTEELSRLAAALDVYAERENIATCQYIIRLMATAAGWDWRCEALADSAHPTPRQHWLPRLGKGQHP